MARDEATLLDIARAARFVLEFKAGMDKAAFFQDVRTQSAILHQLMVIGEAVRRPSEEFRSCHPSVPWGLIAAMCDKKRAWPSSASGSIAKPRGPAPTWTG